MRRVGVHDEGMGAASEPSRGIHRGRVENRVCGTACLRLKPILVRIVLHASARPPPRAIVDDQFLSRRFLWRQLLGVLHHITSRSGAVILWVWRCAGALPSAPQGKSANGRLVAVPHYAILNHQMPIFLSSQWKNPLSVARWKKAVDSALSLEVRRWPPISSSTPCS